MPRGLPSATFVACLSGSVSDRSRLLRTVSDALRPGDEALVALGDYAPVPTTVADRIPPGVSVVHIPHTTLPYAFDHLASLARHEHLVLLGTGCAMAPRELDRLRSALVTRPPGLAAFAPCRRGSEVGLDGRAVIAVTRDVLVSAGGMTDPRARRNETGTVGCGDLFEAFHYAVARSGWSVHVVPQSSVSVRASAADASTSGGAVAPADDGATTPQRRPPSRTISPELRAALGPTAAATARWFSAALPEGQSQALAAVVAGAPEEPQGLAVSDWNVLSLARVLFQRMQGAFAARLLAEADLTAFVADRDLADIAYILSTAGAAGTG